VATCPSCGKDLPGEFPFCPFCAAPLTEQPSASVHEERKVVSVLFCDLVGFTAASDTADPEDVRARIRPYHARLREELERFGGTVEKFVGDAVMAVFGTPVAHEDDAERAVRAGLRMLEAIDELNANDPALSLQVRVGINTGEAVVALDARPELGEGLVTGDVVNTASRLQGAAPVNAVAVSEQTYRATERVFDWERLEPVMVKGKTDPLALWRPLRAQARLGSDVTRTLTTPLVGRELEKTLLIGTFDRATQQSSCQLVTVVGEPGVGKSRLCAELLTNVDRRPGLTRWRQGRCLPYGDGISFWALGEIVKSECGILESDTPTQAAAKLEQAIPEDDPERAWLLARLAPLVGAPAEPASQEESFAAWRRFCEALAAERATVLVFEDLHWADPALLAFLEHLADWAEGVPLLLLCTARPELYERHATFGADARNVQRINLAPLSDNETAQLVSALLERAVLPAETQQRLLEQAGGNPLYAEEFVRLLADRDSAGDAGEVPESVQALIAARLDTLPPERKSLLQDASVLGKVFWAGALTAMGDRDPAEVELALHELARKELVRPARASSMEGEREYAFWHVLVRDVCYGQIPRAGRAARHEAAAAWLEEKAGERVEDLADVLAYHYESALDLSRAAGKGNTEPLQARAVHYLAMAGARALTLDVDRAEHQLSRALELTPDDDPGRASLLERWGHAVQQQGRLQDARRVLDQALDLYREQNDLVAAGRVLTRLGNVTHRLGDPRCEEIMAEAIEVLEAMPPGAEFVSAYTYNAGRGLFTDDTPRVVEGSEKALALAAELDLPEPAFALHLRGLGRGGEEGLEDLRRALELALEQGLGRETAVIYGNLAGSIFGGQGPQAAVDLCREAIAFCERRGIADVGLQIRSGVPAFLAMLGKTEQALAEADLVAEPLEATGDMASLQLRALQMWLLVERGSPERAPDLDQLVDASRETALPGVIAYSLAAAAYVLLARGERERAHAFLREVAELGAFDLTDLGWLGRMALALDDPALAERFDRPDAAAGAERLVGLAVASGLDEHAQVSVRAQLAEAGGDREAAARLYRRAAEGWESFGYVPERAYALLGRGRRLLALGDSAAQQPLTEARELFASMGYRPALAETDSLLGASQPAAS
jgi:class 3 adenylate cyclase/tetratricopeptide (TPR) repeat protein